jgi:hypothetical protein
VSPVTEQTPTVRRRMGASVDCVVFVQIQHRLADDVLSRAVLDDSHYTWKPLIGTETFEKENELKLRV